MYRCLADDAHRYAGRAEPLAGDTGTPAPPIQTTFHHRNVHSFLNLPPSSQPMPLTLLLWLAIHHQSFLLQLCRRHATFLSQQLSPSATARSDNRRLASDDDARQVSRYSTVQSWLLQIFWRAQMHITQSDLKEEQHGDQQI